MFDGRWWSNPGFKIGRWISPVTASVDRRYAEIEGLKSIDMRRAKKMMNQMRQVMKKLILHFKEMKVKMIIEK